MRYWSTKGEKKLRGWIINSITHDSFRMLQRYIHFVKYDILPERGSVLYNLLQKVKPFLDYIQLSRTLAWTLGKIICVDESMIKYMGRYMPAKPIKHGVKVFVCVMHSQEFT